MKKKVFVIMGLTFLVCIFLRAQARVNDSVVINVGYGSRVIVSIKDKRDLETLKHYNFQSLMTDLINKLEAKDTASPGMKPPADYLIEAKNDSVKEPVEEKWTRVEVKSRNEQENNETNYSYHHHKSGTYRSVNFDLGTNNYLGNGKFPDGNNAPYTVRPWGSWYIAANSVHRTRLANKLFLEWGYGLSWYNFKFQKDSTKITKGTSEVFFASDTRNVEFIKSKLTETFVNVSLVPVLDFGGNRRKPMFFDGHRAHSFRIGLGPYAGYRIDSYSKQLINDNGKKRKERNHDNFYLNNFRYGLRLQVGFRDTDIFFNYDLNELFVANKGPNLNAFSFGISF